MYRRCLWSIKLVVPAECGAYGGFDPRWGRHSGGITNLTDQKRLLFFHKNNQKFYKCGAARATAAGLSVRPLRGLASAGFIIEREKAQMFYREN